MTRYSIDIASYFAVIGYDAEMADLDRPRGEIVRERFFLRATDGQGNRRAWGCFTSVENAETQIATAPAVFEWNSIEPAYGSPSFTRFGESELRGWEARHKDAEERGFHDRFFVA